MTTRQDIWSQEGDLLLAEVVLRHIQKGGTQLQAFEEVGKLLSRTPGACGFRWNSFLRKRYKKEIEFSKLQRNKLKEQRQMNRTEEDKSARQVEADYEHNIDQNVKKVPFTFQSIIKYLEEVYNKAQTSSSIEDKEKIKELEMV